jgi:hypothetical protein
MDLATDTLAFTVKASIVESIIGDLFFRDYEVMNDFGSDRDDNVVGAEAKKAAQMIKPKRNAMKMFEKNKEEPYYTATIKNVVRFELAIDHISIGISFRQVAGAIQHAKDRTKLSKLSGINDLIVGQYVRVLVATNLQMIVDMQRRHGLGLFAGGRWQHSPWPVVLLPPHAHLFEGLAAQSAPRGHSHV